MWWYALRSGGATAVDRVRARSAARADGIGDAQSADRTTARIPTELLVPRSVFRAFTAPTNPKLAKAAIVRLRPSSGLRRLPSGARPATGAGAAELRALQQAIADMNTTIQQLTAQVAANKQSNRDSIQTLRTELQRLLNRNRDTSKDVQQRTRPDFGPGAVDARDYRPKVDRRIFKFINALRQGQDVDPPASDLDKKLLEFARSLCGIQPRRHPDEIPDEDDDGYVPFRCHRHRRGHGAAAGAGGGR